MLRYLLNNWIFCDFAFNSACNNDLESFSKNINATEIEKIVKNLRYIQTSEAMSA